MAASIGAANLNTTFAYLDRVEVGRRGSTRRLGPGSDAGAYFCSVFGAGTKSPMPNRKGGWVWRGFLLSMTLQSETLARMACWPDDRRKFGSKSPRLTIDRSEPWPARGSRGYFQLR